MNKRTCGLILVLFGLITAYVIAASSAWAATTDLPQSNISTPAATPTFWEPPVPPTPKPAVEEPIVTYEVHGPSSGQHLLLELFNDANLRFKYGATTFEDQDRNPDIYHVLSLARSADFFDLKGSYGRANIRNGLYDEITISQGGRAKTITLSETDLGGAPQGLLDLVAFLRAVSKDSWSWTNKPDHPFPLPAFPPANVKSKAYTITFELIAMGFTGSFQIDPDGKATLYEYLPSYGDTVGWSSYLTPTLLSQLTSQIDAVDFFNLTYESVTAGLPTPTAPFAMPTDLSYPTIIITQGGRSNSIEGVYNDHNPGQNALLETLFQILDYLSRDNIAYGDRDVFITVDATNCAGARWFMDIDTEGRAFVGFNYIGTLSSDELDALKRIFIDGDWFSLADKYNISSGNAEEDTYCREGGADVSFTLQGNTKEVIAGAGPNVPIVIDKALTKLAGVFARFQRAPVVLPRPDVGMPKSGNANSPTFAWVVLSGTLLLIGVSLRLLPYAARQYTKQRGTDPHGTDQ